jgi:hypothetical protein
MERSSQVHATGALRPRKRPGTYSFARVAVLEKKKICCVCRDSNPGSLIFFARRECNDEREMRGRVFPSVCVTHETTVSTVIDEVW